MKAIIVTVVLFLAGPLSANERHCEAVESAGEGHWPIAEERFTKENARIALKSLNDFVEGVDFDRDPPSGERIYEEETAFMMLKGYFYVLAIKQNPEDNRLKADFCEFIQKEAYVRH